MPNRRTYARLMTERDLSTSERDIQRLLQSFKTQTHDYDRLMEYEDPVMHAGKVTLNFSSKDVRPRPVEYKFFDAAKKLHWFYEDIAYKAEREGHRLKTNQKLGLFQITKSDKDINRYKNVHTNTLVLNMTFDHWFTWAAAKYSSKKDWKYAIIQTTRTLRYMLDIFKESK